jgi:NADH:ubiquinone oxidoreductase subunit 3 (subunit A)
MVTDILTSLPFVFLLCLAVGLTLYLIGGLVGAKSKESADKIAPYTGGEDLPPRQLQIDVERFFIYAVYFLIFDILAFILATSLNTPGFFPALYATIVLMGIVLLLPLWRRK